MLAIVAAVLATAGGSAHARIVRWAPEELGPREVLAPAPLGPGELRVVTLNAWKLEAAERVPGYLGAVDGVGAALARGAGDRPELVAIQEIQSRAAIAELERRFAGEGVHVASCICSLRADGSVREAVMAVTAPPFAASGHACIDLGAMEPDHSRCAAVVTGELGGERADFVSAHLAWHPDNAPMAEVLARALRARGALGPGTIVAGDLNALPGSEAHRALTVAGLRDARPGAPRTHFLGGRIDYVLTGAGLEVVRGIDRRASYDLVRPIAAFDAPSACERQGPPACPVSDHLPEAVVLRPR